MSFARLVDDALACLAAEHPEAHRRMRASLGGRRVEARVGDELVTFGSEDAARTAVQVRASVKTLSAVLLGEADLVEEVRSYRLEVMGASGDLVALGEAMNWFIEGAMRCVSIQGIVDRLMAMRGEDQHG